MEDFQFHLPTKVLFGSGQLSVVGKTVAEFGSRCLLVTGPTTGSVKHFMGRLMAYLTDEGIAVAHFDGVIQNPTTDVISAGASMAVPAGWSCIPVKL